VLTGLVSRAQDGLALSGATVRVSAGTDAGIERVVRTDALGRYRCEGLPPGPIGMIVAPEQEAMTRWEELLLAPGQTLQHDVQVGAGEPVRGRVLDGRSGAPIEGAEVSAWHFVYKTVRTDAHGAFEIAGTPGRQIELSARAAGFGQTDVRVLDTREGVELRLAPGRRAIGRVRAWNGEALAGAFVAATAYDGSTGVALSDTRTCSTSVDGRFELTDLRADIAHTLIVRASDCGARFESLAAADSDVIEIGDIVLERAAGLEGRILDAGGTPCVGASVVLRPIPADAACQFAADLHGRRSVGSDANGRFVFRDLAPGAWILMLQGAELSPPPEQSLRLAAGEFRRGFDLRLGEELSIEGSVGDEQGHALAGAHVLATPEDGARGGGSRVCDADGRFRIAGLKPGSYRLQVQGPRPESASCSRFDDLRQLHVAAGTRGLELRLLARSGSIRGRVLDSDGKPLAGAFVFRIEQGFPPQEFVLSDAQGRFELPVVPDDALQLFFQRGIPVSQALRTPSYAEARAGRVVDGDAAARVQTDFLRAGSEDVELRLPAPR
jgi:protocatechuate 3,4-dioxygenase beta subunit